ncbi:TetR/AcrR family transcriptional regulator C-terminal domain-containing protein [Planobispora takensis]|uniref:GntR family transcriptional regulator n=1 Tax=Planobispora takensis TaxID=1367882 RepID=A0A8J3T232_9ACTN|nr:TetR/AcrR family transcriptional regulator C-terminal domain-containing protein [Planobispora takensis]GIH99658.1 GntR family transcriptional regulator [Planobispora takensis]
MTGEIDPPYLRIAAEIRRRIADGELAPGDRVPSTRRIAREWGVALATATRALAKLSQEGVVQARPRAGTVVAPRDPAPERVRPRAAGSERTRPRAAGPDRELTRERIVRAAIEIADAEGLDALSMRGVAARLGVATMSPYRYVDGKDELILLMADAAYAEGTYPDDPPQGWRARLELGARTMWALYRRHPWLAQISSLSRPLPLGGLAGHAEWALATLDARGLGPDRAFELHLLLYTFVHGLAVNLERGAQAEAATGLTDDQWMDSQQAAFEAIVASGRYPVFTRTLTFFADGYDLDLDALFEVGLAALLDGFATLPGLS